jgi:hypothetical protein
LHNCDLLKLLPCHSHNIVKLKETEKDEEGNVYEKQKQDMEVATVFWFGGLKGGHLFGDLGLVGGNVLKIVIGQ